MDSVIDHLKAEVRRLQRASRQREPGALARARKLPELRALSDTDLVSTLQRRHCLTAVARELGFQGWPHVLTVLQRADADDFGTLLYPPGCSAHWNVWSAAYEEARAIRSEHGGFLLPYKHQYVIVDQYFIETLGLDPGALDWARIGRDWVRPLDADARHRLCVEAGTCAPAKPAGALKRAATPRASESSATNAARR
ncbi:MAG: hypothetical protein RLZZ450_4930 [Pseudomonadota bacterium]|jgi:hypothetical protein